MDESDRPVYAASPAYRNLLQRVDGKDVSGYQVPLGEHAQVSMIIALMDLALDHDEGRVTDAEFATRAKERLLQ